MISIDAKQLVVSFWLADCDWLPTQFALLHVDAGRAALLGVIAGRIWWLNHLVIKMYVMGEEVTP